MCPEHGWLAAFRAHLLLGRDPVEAQRLGPRAREAGAGLGVVDLEMFGLATEGLAPVNQGEVGEGMRRLDEAAAAALGGEYEQLAPAGWTCCYLIYAALIADVAAAIADRVDDDGVVLAQETHVVLARR